MATVALTVPQMVDDSFIRWRSDCLEDCSMIDSYLLPVNGFAATSNLSLVFSIFSIR
jgi:hypothetical protein